MKVLLVHNYYGSGAPSGENVVFDTETELLEQRGHEVRRFLKYSDALRGKGALGVVLGAFSTPWNFWSASEISNEVERFKPDIVHVHNTFPILSPAIFHSMGKSAARVLTLHNYRVFCPAAIPMRGNNVCTECMDNKSSWPAVRYGCYRGSRSATIPMAFSVMLHRFLGTWIHNVEAFIALTDFQKKLLVDAGLPSERVYTKPNFYPGNPVQVPWLTRGNYAIFAGRLSYEKGVSYLIRAWQEWGEAAPELRIIGDGPLKDSLMRLVSERPDVNIRMMGQLPAADAERNISEARLLILPSVCFEGFPMVVREAFAFGTPAAVSNIGALPEIVNKNVNGLVFEAGDSTSLCKTVRTVWEQDGTLQELGKGAHAEFLAKYNSDTNYSMLMDIYEKAIRRRVSS